MTDQPESEKIVLLQAHQKYQEKMNEQVIDRLDSIDGKVEIIVKQIADSKGFIRGVIFTVTIIGGVIGATIATVFEWIRQK